MEYRNKKGYEIRKGIATVSEGEILSLGNKPNHVTFTPVRSDSVALEYQIKVRSFTENERFTVIEFLFSDNRIVVRGTRDKDKVGGEYFYITNNLNDVAENIRVALLRNLYFESNFNIDIPLNVNGQNVTGGDVIVITSKGAGVSYNHSLSYSSRFIRLSGNPSGSVNNNSLDIGDGSTDVELDVYSVDNINLGGDDTPSGGDLGRWITTLNKRYFDKSIWFNLNALIGKSLPYSDEFLTASGWCDAGTVAAYRFVAKVYDGASRIAFYLSRVNFVVNGYNRQLEPTGLLIPFTYDILESDAPIFPLTNLYRRRWQIGQSDFFNFILTDRQRGVTNFDIGIRYTYYTQSGEQIKTEIKQKIDKNELSTINTIRLDPDVSDLGRVCGRFTVELTNNANVISKPITFDVVPECFRKIKTVAFLNKLGGWDAFHFEGGRSSSFKTSRESIYKNVYPDSRISDEIESVFRVDVEDSFKVGTGLIDGATKEWLKELSASKEVYELSTQRKINIVKFEINTDSGDDSYELTMEYKYSDTYR